MDAKQFKYRIAIPALTRIGLSEPVRVSLVVGTCLHESEGLQFVVQLPNGPALGFGQMEPATHDDIWRNFLAYKPELAAKVRALCGSFEGNMPPSSELIGNANYAVAMVAVHYRRLPAALPREEAYSLAAYWKQFYNTPLGKGTIEGAVKQFYRAIEI